MLDNFDADTDELTPEEALASAVVPGSFRGKKALYLSYRVTGFSIRESMQLANCSQRSVLRWRELDPEFERTDTKGLTELRRELGIEYLGLEFLRNYRLFLDKDYKVVMKALYTPEAMSDDEKQYLLKARVHYTPQQLQILDDLTKGTSSQDEYIGIIRRLRTSPPLAITSPTTKLEPTIDITPRDIDAY